MASLGFFQGTLRGEAFRCRPKVPPLEAPRLPLTGLLGVLQKIRNSVVVFSSLNKQKRPVGSQKHTPVFKEHVELGPIATWKSVGGVPSPE